MFPFHFLSTLLRNLISKSNVNAKFRLETVKLAYHRSLAFSDKVNILHKINFLVVEIQQYDYQRCQKLPFDLENIF